MIINKLKRKSGEKLIGDNYIYASSLIRTREINRINYDALLRMADAKDVSEICKILPEYSIEPIYNKHGEIDAEETVTRYLAEEFRVAAKAMPKSDVLDFLKIPYDCHNLKTVIKCAFRERENCEELFIDLGTVPASEVLKSIKSKKENAFPTHMAEAYGKAEKAFAESGDPKLIDSILDEACYADMLDTVGAYRNSYFKKLVEIKIDTTNLTTALRVLRMGDTTGLFDSMFIAGGSLDIDFFKKSMQDSETALLTSVKSKGYDISIQKDERISLTQLGKVCEDIYMAQVQSARSIPFGAEVCASYLIRASYATKMLRTVIAAKQTGIESARIKEGIGKF